MFVQGGDVATDLSLLVVLHMLPWVGIGLVLPPEEGRQGGKAVCYALDCKILEWHTLL